ncbi:MAG: AAA family ATPase [Candidatus Thiodiazotropha sp. (ex Troendleina suluensis)]|nr:AAA family ATPase [Candidatus Thiodiazotropha sp. (ex Troendleina suluensis)]
MKKMYESFFGFKDTPFRLSADEKFRYAHKNYKRASAYMAYALEQGEGFVMITGSPGSGKTTLCRDVISEIDSSKIDVINLVTSQLQAEELLRKVALEYGLPAESFNKATLLTSIHKHIADLHSTGKRSIIFLDEAQNLTSNGLEELRLLSNLQEGKHSLLQIVLIGHGELRESVLSPGMEHIQQRLIATCHLEPMTAEQTEGYITHRLGMVGWNSDPSFQQSTFSLIYLVTQGVPRQVNHIMSRLLLFAAIESKHHLNDEDVLLVVQELVEENRLSLMGDVSFTSFKERYFATKQEHSVQVHSIESLSEDISGLNNDPQENISTEDREATVNQKIDENSLIAVRDADADRACLLGSDDDWELPDTDWFGWDDESQDDISSPSCSRSANSSGEPIGIQQERDNLKQSYSGQIEDTALWEDSDEVSLGLFEIEPLYIQSSTNSDTYTIGSASDCFDHDQNNNRDDHQWGGVWWMSNSNSQGESEAMLGSSNSRDRLKQRSINMLRLATDDKNNSTGQGYDNLKLPSVWIDGCPDIHNTQATAPFNEGNKIEVTNFHKRSYVRIIYLVSLGLLVLFLLQFLPSNLRLQWRNSMEEYFGLLNHAKSRYVYLEAKVEMTIDGTQITSEYYPNRNS